MAKEPKQVFVKPAPGCMIRDNLTRRFLDKDGELKPLTNYWVRRIRMVDVVMTQQKSAGSPNSQTRTDVKVSENAKAGKGKDQK